MHLDGPRGALHTFGVYLDPADKSGRRKFRGDYIGCRCADVTIVTDEATSHRQKCEMLLLFVCIMCTHDLTVGNIFMNIIRDTVKLNKDNCVCTFDTRSKSLY